MNPLGAKKNRIALCDAANNNPSGFFRFPEETCRAGCTDRLYGLHCPPVVRLEIDPDMLIPDRSKTLNGGAIILKEWGGPRQEGGYYWQTLEAAAKAYNEAFGGL